MAAATGSLDDVERTRLQLEATVSQLRKALQHWQTWDAEYEALKEEVEALAEDADEGEALRRIHDEFYGDLLHGKELDDIFGGAHVRQPDQIVGLLQRRIDYVSKNVGSLQKQLENAENRFAAVATSSTQSSSDDADDDGQPITEIVEELDDDDNVLSYHLNRPGDAVPKVREALEKAGVTPSSTSETPSASQIVADSSLQSAPNPVQVKPKPVDRSQRPSEPAPTLEPKKVVSFTEDVTMEDAPAPPPDAKMSRQARRVEHIMNTAKEQESMDMKDAVIPDDEDEDDAELRQQMLSYSMGEVGAVVAELEIEEDDTDYDDDDRFEDGDEGFEEGDDDDEDKWGRTTSLMGAEAYRQRILELERVIADRTKPFRAIQATQVEEEGESSDDGEGIGRIVIKKAESAPSASKPAPTKSNLKDKQANGEGKKGVRFAQNLDIAPESEVEHVAPALQERGEPLVEPLSDIVERSSSSKVAEPPVPRKQSRFKKARGEGSSSGGLPKGPFDAPPRLLEGDQQRDTPTGPDGTTLAERLVERETTSAPPSGFEDPLDQNAVADEYQRLRKRFIHRQGGFLKEDETPTREFVDGDEPQEHISRFKAARLSRQ
ncbi:udp-galactose transporter like protein [Purpureocillium lavendulum]|uniref:Udp-galactose transporter like protein n=1 Tax=Purpureocillium lavendulum TaxID=1247861 RepID=A0AB34FVC8_9HYPO|nr:udp-galactose transporter like protein [Purpureocillium lavendulum]